MKIEKSGVAKYVSKLANQFGYTVIPTELWEQIQNELASVVDAIKVYENKEGDEK